VISLTPTKLRDFLTCPQMFKLRHLDRVGSESNPAALSFGRSLHAALDELHRDGDVGGPPSITEPSRLLKRHWEAGAYADRQESDSYFAKGCEALRRYVSESGPFPGRILGTEVFMSCVINFSGLRIKFGCKADRVAVDERGVLEVLDYKTGASGKLPTPESLAGDLPNFIYYLLARINYPDFRRVRVSQLNVLTLARVHVEYDEVQIAANKKNLLAQARAFASSNFGPAPSEACAWCHVQDHCPAFNKEFDFESVI
jgi:putative RecB family exonuclease